MCVWQQIAVVTAAPVTPAGLTLESHQSTVLAAGGGVSFQRIRTGQWFFCFPGRERSVLIVTVWHNSLPSNILITALFRQRDFTVETDYGMLAVTFL